MMPCFAVWSEEGWHRSYTKLQQVQLGTTRCPIAQH